MGAAGRFRGCLDVWPIHSPKFTRESGRSVISLVGNSNEARDAWCHAARGRIMQAVRATPRMKPVFLLRGEASVIDFGWNEKWDPRNVSRLSASMRTPGHSGVTESTKDFGTPLAVSIKNLSVTLKSEGGDVPVLERCSLNVPEGQLWMLLGPNGCGKSTLLKALAGLLKPDHGKMFVTGPRSFVFQNPDHQVVMPTAEADVAFGLGRLDLSVEEVRERVHNSLRAVGMHEYAQRPVQTLSGGQKQRIAIAGALAESSRLLLLDELTTYLDRGDQLGVLNAVRQIVGGSQRVTAIWVTHRLEELEFADGAVYMENGGVVLTGSGSEISSYLKRKQDELIK